jgi:hypothetical protein
MLSPKVMSTVFPTETLVTLPSTLSGDYEIQLQVGNWLFTGLISCKKDY